MRWRTDCGRTAAGRHPRPLVAGSGEPFKSTNRQRPRTLAAEYQPVTKDAGERLWLINDRSQTHRAFDCSGFHPRSRPLIHVLSVVLGAASEPQISSPTTRPAPPPPRTAQSPPRSAPATTRRQPRRHRQERSPGPAAKWAGPRPGTAESPEPSTTHRSATAPPRQPSGTPGHRDQQRPDHRTQDHSRNGPQQHPPSQLARTLNPRPEIAATPPVSRPR